MASWHLAGFLAVLAHRYWRYLNRDPRVCTAAVFTLYLLKTDLGIALAFSDDVGMSGGGFGCVGGWVSRLPRPWLKRVFVGVLIYLVGHLIIVTDLFADILHIVTFFLGFWLDGKLSSNKTSESVVS